MRVAMLTTDNRETFRKYSNPQPQFHGALEALFQGFAAMPEIEIHVLSCSQQPTTSPKKIAPNIFFHSLHVPKIGWLRTGYQGCVRAFRKKFREIQPAIVHGQGTERDCALGAIFSGFPNVLTIHGNMRLIAQVNRARPFSFYWLTARLESFTLPRTNGVICITNYTQAAVKNLAKRTWILPNAVDESFFELKNSTAKKAPIILCVGTICHRKNQNNFIRALDPLAAQKKFQLIFLGQADETDYSAEFFELIKSRAWCVHEKFSGRERVKEFFQSATMLALPTLEDNCPMVVLEAMAAGVPVLASNVGGVPDLIVPEKTGLFCDPQQPETFRDGVKRLLEDRELAGRLATAARVEARERFRPRVIAQKHLEIYREILAGR